MNYAITKPISLERVADMICGAREGGSGYWASSIRPLSGYKLPKPNNECTLDDLNAWYLDCATNGVRVKSNEKPTDDAPDFYEITPEKINIGLNIMADKYPKHLADMLAENDDGETHDVFMQCITFGEIIFG